VVESSQGSDKEQILLKCWFGFLDDQAVGGLQHDLPGCVRGIVIGQRLPEGIQRHHLGDHIEGVSNGKLEVDVGKRFEPCAEF
jgi:hypothetical protein